jgi:hypothetical protein
MTADGDMMPCSNYWHPNENEITCYGHDLTGYGHYPICYVAMNSNEWRRVMNITDGEMMPQIESLLDKYEQASSDNWEQWCINNFLDRFNLEFKTDNYKYLTCPNECDDTCWQKIIYNGNESILSQWKKHR